MEIIPYIQRERISSVNDLITDFRSIVLKYLLENP